MPSIVTITFNPCIDKSVSVPLLVPDKKLHCTVDQLQPGGGGINVARVIQRLGLPVTAIYPAGGSSGALLSNLLAKEAVATITIATSCPVRENIILTETATHKQYRLGMPGEALTIQEWNACMQALNEAEELSFIVVSGSIPENAPRDLFRQIATIARQKQAKLIVDAAGETLQMAVGVGAYLIKPNLAELSELTGKKLTNEYEIQKAAQELVTAGHCNIVVVSMDARGAMLVTADKCYRAIPPIMKPKSSVGAGDSMVAGIVYSLSLSKTLPETLQMGVACGSAAIMNTGTSLCHPDDVNKLYNEIKIFLLTMVASPE
jgi:6-phosphofructokinase 2